MMASLLRSRVRTTIAMTTALGWKFQSGVLLWAVAIASLTLIALLAKRIGLRVGPIGREPNASVAEPGAG